ncbi:hypothetical protein EDD86DRAFT_205203 [Gorgonomyces haynaldii]|nr:hypothetical protein EDD86DRAFT_205203 [Gorgonomyces haynaldii]
MQQLKQIKNVELEYDTVLEVAQNTLELDDLCYLLMPLGLKLTDNHQTYLKLKGIEILHCIVNKTPHSLLRHKGYMDLIQDQVKNLLTWTSDIQIFQSSLKLLLALPCDFMSELLRISVYCQDQSLQELFQTFLVLVKRMESETFKYMESLVGLCLDHLEQSFALLQLVLETCWPAIPNYSQEILSVVGEYLIYNGDLAKADPVLKLIATDKERISDFKLLSELLPSLHRYIPTEE